jgi:phage tail-like protein
VAQTGQRVDPYANYNFLVEIDGITQAGFSDVSGFDTSIEVHEYREGSDPTTTRKLPGMTRYSNITLRRGLTADRTLYDWMLGTAHGTITRKNGSILVLDAMGNEVVRWNFRNAWPTRWQGPELSARSNDVAIETLELAHEGVERAR